MDSNITIGLRRGMIEDLRTLLIERGFTNFEVILDAMHKIPRHEFAPIGFENIAYEIQPLLIDEDQTMSSPLTVAIQTILLNPQKNEKILEIGTGSGYQASVLSLLCGEVYTLERHKILHEKAKIFFRNSGFRNIYTYLKDGFEGLPSIAPFDKIIITCGASEMPETLFNQLKVGGEMLIPMSEDENSYIRRIIKLNSEEIYEERFDGFQFVPMLKGINK